MSKDFNISIICLILNWFVYDPSWMLHLSEFVRTLRSSVLVVFNNFLLIDATARSKISSDQKRFFIALSLYPLSFFANTPFKSEPGLLRLNLNLNLHCSNYNWIWTGINPTILEPEPGLLRQIQEVGGGGEGKFLKITPRAT